LFTASYWASGGTSVIPSYASGDKESFLHVSNPIGQTEWEDGDITGVTLGPNDKGSLDFYVSSPATGSTFIISVFVEEGPFDNTLNLAGANTDSIKSW
jgi:hypothetical protein